MLLVPEVVVDGPAMGAGIVVDEEAMFVMIREKVAGEKAEDVC